MSRARRYDPLAFFFAIAAVLFPNHLQAGTACPEVIGAPLSVKDVVTGDFDGDRLADMAVAGNAKIVIVFGDSGVRPTRVGGTIVTGVTFSALITGDFDDDGDLDLVAGTGNYVRVLLGDGTGSFTFGGIYESSELIRMDVGDFNGDGHLDLAGANGDAAVALFGDGAGGFGPEQTLITIPEHIIDVAAGDLNEDGRADLVVPLTHVANLTTLHAVAALLGNADGSFTALPYQDLPQLAFSIDLGDLNEDGHLDAVIGARTVMVCPGHGDGSFDTSTLPVSTNSSGGRIRLGDIDGDGHLDAVSVGGPGVSFDTCPVTGVNYLRGGGDGTLAAPQSFPWVRNSLTLALGDVNGDGYMDAVELSCGNLAVHPGGPSGLHILTNPARAFVIKNNDVIRLNSNKATWCVQVEAINGSIDLERDFPINIVLVSEGTGSQNTAIYNSKQLVLGDADNNGIPDAQFCFSKAQLRPLFDGIHGRQLVNVTVEGDLRTDMICRFSAPLTVEIIPGGNGNGAAAITPNVFAARSTLSLETLERGRVRARVFDVSGRLVRTLRDETAEAGIQRIPVDARDDKGRPLASGVYFFRIDSSSGPESGRFVIAR
jgi:hypothetical protein